MNDMKKMIKDAAVLLVITVMAGLILGFVYQITKEPIAAAKEKAAKEAYQEVFPDASDFSAPLELAAPEGDTTWDTNYKNYFTKSGNEYTSVSAGSAPSWEASKYYTAGTEARLPLPDEIASIFAEG